MLDLIKSSLNRVDLTNFDVCEVCDVIRTVSLDRKTASYWKDSIGTASPSVYAWLCFKRSTTKVAEDGGSSGGDDGTVRRQTPGRLMKRWETDRSNAQTNDRTFNESAPVSKR